MRRKHAPEPKAVNVNGQYLARMSTEDVFSYTETALMSSGYHLTQWRSVHRVIDDSHLEQAIMQAEWALEGLRALRDRR